MNDRGLSETLQSYFDAPPRAGRMAPGPGVHRGEAGAAASGALVRFSLRVSGARIEDARFQAFGCSWTIATASYVADWLVGRSMEDAALDVGSLVTTLTLPAAKVHAARLAVEALASALKSGAAAPSRPVDENAQEVNHHHAGHHH